MDEWDQQIADSRSVETMRRIAQDAMCFGDDGAAFYTYADQHKLTVNEIVYYLNAYEAGGDEGLRTLRAPDIIPPEIAATGDRTGGSDETQSQGGYERTGHRVELEHVRMGPLPGS
jgi:hypothetical protein